MNTRAGLVHCKQGEGVQGERVQGGGGCRGGCRGEGVQGVDL